MKSIKIYMAIAALGLIASSCELDKYPENAYNQYNYQSSEGDLDNPYTTRADIEGALTTMYNNIKSNIQEPGWSDYLIYTEVMVDNAYCGAVGTPELVGLEAHTFDGANKNIDRDWDFYLNGVMDANQIITYIDQIEDASFSQGDRNGMKAQAMIWRAFLWFSMSQLWGDVPMVDQVPPAITSDNVEEVYPLYFPERTDQVTLYKRIAQDLEWAVQYAPALNPSDKFVCSKAFGYGVLARLYAEKPIQDYGQVALACEQIEGMNLDLVPDFGTLWAYGATDVVARHTIESIFEVPYTPSQGNWVWMMFWRNGLSNNPDDSFGWAKWVTPSRNLAAAFDAAGDTERKEQSIFYDQCGWSYFYPADNYAFMYKTRCNAASIIKMRLGEILLLHAEALVYTNDLPGAAALVDRVRDRAGLGGLPAQTKASQSLMIDAVLNERRLELAFEGHRWFDLIRNDRAVDCVNNLNTVGSVYYDAQKPAVRKIDARGLLLPVPNNKIDVNPKLTQNPGY